MSYGLTIMQIRKDRGMTQAELADKLHWTQSRVSRIESGKQDPTVNDIEDMLFALRATASERSVVWQVR